MKLYEISEMYHDFMFAYENGEIPEDAFYDTLEAIETSFTDKCDNVACMVKEYEAAAAAIKEEIRKLQERMKTKENQAARLREYIASCMTSMKVRSIESPRVRLSFRASEAVEVEDEEKLINYLQAAHEDFLTYKAPAVNKTAIKAAIKDGEEIPGAQLVKRENLQIK